VKVTYRPEIDGLRAIAVVSVIFYHAQLTIFGNQYFKGGFIGVDIFFVISGYLITSLILKELKNSGKFSFLNFYQRRARRILPALFLVMFVSLPFAWRYLFPTNFIDFLKSVLYSLGFSSNFYFHYSDLTYGTEDGLLKPFLHTWSLSVEEQYYIFFPLLLLVAFKYFKKYLLIILIISFIISLQIADWSSKNYPSINFYFLHTRIWELLAGSILSYFEIQQNGRSNKLLLNQILTVCGLFLILHSIVFFNDKMFHPSYYTISPIIGVCLIIWFSNKNEFVTKILSSKLFVGTGLISYSLYLWHYPIFAFGRIKEGLPTQHEKFKWMIITVILSVLSYFLIEKIFRNKKYKFKKLFLPLSVSFLILCALYASFYSLSLKGDFKDRIPTYLKKDFEKKPWKKLYQNEELCHNRQDNFCIHNKDKKIKVYLIGDSIPSALMPELIKTLNNYRIIQMTNGFCFYNPNFNEFDKKTQKLNINRCTNFFQNNIKNILLNEKDKSFVIFSGQLKSYIEGNKHKNIINENNYIKNLKKEFNILSKNKNLKLFLLGPFPQFKENILHKLQKEKTLTLAERELTLSKIKIKYSKKKFLKENKKVFDFINFFKNLNGNIIMVDDLFCDKEYCYSNDKKNIFVVDVHHPSSYSSKIISKKILKKIIEKN